MAKRARREKRKARGPRIIRSGHCIRCGECCGMDPHGDEFKKMELRTFDARLGKAIADGHSEPYPLDPICAHLKKLRDGTFICAIYPDRPMGCRTWPTHPHQLIKIPRCSYKFEIIRKYPSVKQTLKAELKAAKKIEQRAPGIEVEV